MAQLENYEGNSFEGTRNRMHEFYSSPKGINKVEHIGNTNIFNSLVDYADIQNKSRDERDKLRNELA